MSEEANSVDEYKLDNDENYKWIFNRIEEFVGTPYSDPPQLESFLKDPDYVKVAEMISASISLFSKGSISLQSSQNLDLAIRLFVKEVAMSNFSNREEDISEIVNKRNQQEIALIQAKKDLVESERIRKELLEVNKENTDDVKGLQAEKDELVKSKDQAIREKKALKREYENKLTVEKQRYDALDDSVRVLHEQMKSKDDIIESLREQIDQLNDEKASLHDKIREIQAKSEKRKEELKKLENEYNILSNDLQDTKLALEDANMNKSIEELDKHDLSNRKLAKENSRLKERIKELNNITDEQSLKIVKLSDINDRYEQQFEVLQEQNKELVNKNKNLKSEIKTLSDTIEKMDKQTDSIRSQFDSLRIDSKGEINDILELKETYGKMLHLAEPLFKDKNETLFQLFARLVSMKGDTDVISENKRLKGLANHLVKLIDELLTGSGNFEDLSIFDDVTLRDRTIQRLNQLREELGDNDDMAFNSLFGDDIKTERTLENINEPDGYAAIVALTAVNRITRQAYNKLLEDLRPLRKFLPKETNDMSLGVALSNYFGKVIPAAQELSFTLKTSLSYSGGSTDPFEIMNEYISDSVKTLQQIVHEYKNFNEYVFNGVISDIPGYLRQIIRSLRQEISHLTIDSDNLRRNTVSLNQKNVDLIEDFKEQEKALRDEFAQKELDLNEKILNLTQKYHDAIEKTSLINEEKIELEYTVNELNNGRDELERTCKSHKAEIKRLNELILERTNAFNNRLNEALKTERSTNEDHIKRITKQYTSQLAVTKDQLEIKTKKYNQLKKNSKDTAASLQNTISNQRELIKTILNKNKILSEQLSDTGSIESLKGQINDLEEKLQKEQTEKHQIILQYQKNANIPSINTHMCQLDIISKKLEECGYERPEDGWDASSISEVINSIVTKLRLASLNKSIIPRTKTMQKIIDDWSIWSTKTLKDCYIDIPKQLDDVRSILHDLCVVGSKQASAVFIMQTLRAEKSILVPLVDLTKKSSELSLQHVVWSIFFVKSIESRSVLTLARNTLSSIDAEQAELLD